MTLLIQKSLYHFRNEKVTAPLKGRFDRCKLNSKNNFRNEKVTAPLKAKFSVASAVA